MPFTASTPLPTLMAFSVLAMGGNSDRLMAIMRLDGCSRSRWSRKPRKISFGFVPRRVLGEPTDGFHHGVLERNVALDVLLDSSEIDLFGWTNTNFVGV